MPERVPVFVYARDPVSQAGISAQLRGRADVRVVEDGDMDDAAVAVVVADDVDEDTVRSIKAIQRNGCPRVVLVVTRADDGQVFTAVEAGACGLLRRSDASPDTLARAIESATCGDGTMPPDLLGRFLAHVGRLQRQVLAPRGLSFTGLSDREIEVLKLVADGMDTAEIGKRLSYSERTIKNIIHDLTTRLQLRNRSHAVAYAMREGLI